MHCCSTFSFKIQVTHFSQVLEYSSNNIWKSANVKLVFHLCSEISFQACGNIMEGITDTFNPLFAQDLSESVSNYLKHDRRCYWVLSHVDHVVVLEVWNGVFRIDDLWTLSCTTTLMGIQTQWPGFDSSRPILQSEVIFLYYLCMKLGSFPTKLPLWHSFNRMHQWVPH